MPIAISRPGELLAAANRAENVEDAGNNNPGLPQSRSYPSSSCRISSSACISLRAAASRLSVSALRLPS